MNAPPITELSDRARDVFRMVVEAYLDSGAPVGSRTLAMRPGLSLSPASIRNVMQDLEELGLLAAPHTSAGRMPTDVGLRLFVDGMMHALEPSLEERAAIEAQVPVQPYALRYMDADGRLHDSADFIGEMTFVESVIAILQSGGMHAELIRLPAIPTDGAHRRELAAAARELVSNALSPASDAAGSRLAPTDGLTSAVR